MSALARRLASPVRERRFTYARYERFLDRLAAAEHVALVPLRELRADPPAGTALVGLRHDVDGRLESALEFARLEHARGIRATYFVLHTADYWSRPTLVDSLLAIQDELGHEIGWHNDLVTLQCVLGVDARAYLARELQRLRAAGIRIVGSASHGSPHCYRLGYHNNYFFRELARPVEGFPALDVVQTRRGPCRIERASLADFGLEYEAYHLGNRLYFSDASFAGGRRWHPEEVDPAALVPGERAVILVHPDHWDASVAAKAARLPGHLVRTAARRASDLRAEARR